MRSIDMKQIIWECILEWKKIFVSILIFCVLGVAIILVNSDSETETETKSVNQLFEELPVESQNKVDSLLCYEEEYNYQADYLRNSLIMNMDTNNVNTAILIYRIKETGDKNTNYGIQELYQKVATVVETENVTYVSELISVDNVKYLDTKDVQDEITLDAMTDSEYLEIRIIGRNMEECNQIATIVKEHIEEVELNNLELLGESSYCGVDAELKVYKNTEINRAAGLYSSISTIKAGMTSDELECYEMLAGGNEMVTIQTPQVSNKKVMVLMLGFGVIIGVMYVIFRILFLQVVNIEDDIYGIFGHDDLGVLLEQKKQRKGIKTIYYNHRKDIKTVSYLANKLDIKLKKNELKNVTVVCEKDSKQITELCEMLKQENLNVAMVMDSLNNANSYKALCESESAIIVLEPQVSLIDDIIEKINICKQHNVEILGIVKSVCV